MFTGKIHSWPTFVHLYRLQKSRSCFTTREGQYPLSNYLLYISLLMPVYVSFLLYIFSFSASTYSCVRRTIASLSVDTTYSAINILQKYLCLCITIIYSMCWLDVSSLLGFLFPSAAHLIPWKALLARQSNEDIKLYFAIELAFAEYSEYFHPSERVHDLCSLTVDIYLPFLSFPALFLSFMILIPEWPITVCLLFLHTLGMTSFMLISGFLYLLHSSKPLFSFANSSRGVATQQCSYLWLPTQLPQ